MASMHAESPDSDTTEDESSNESNDAKHRGRPEDPAVEASHPPSGGAHRDEG